MVVAKVDRVRWRIRQDTARIQPGCSQDAAKTQPSCRSIAERKCMEVLDSLGGCKPATYGQAGKWKARLYLVKAHAIQVYCVTG